MDVHSPRITLFGDGTPQRETLARRVHRHKRAAFKAFAETDLTFGQREDGVVTTQANVITGVPLCAALPDDDVARNDFLATEFFYAKALAC